MSEQLEAEQLQQVKGWLQENWKTLLLGGLLGIGIAGGWSGWNFYRGDASARLSEDFFSLQNQSFLLYRNAGNSEYPAADLELEYAQLSTQGEAFIAEHEGSLYADFAALLLARAAVEQGEYASASAQLERVYQDGGELATRETARLRLAAVLWQQGEAERALELLQRQPIASEFAGLFAELSGDIAYGLGNHAEAYNFYQEAARLQGSQQTLPLLNPKLNNARVLAAE